MHQQPYTELWIQQKNKIRNTTTIESLIIALLLTTEKTQRQLVNSKEKITSKYTAVKPNAYQIHQYLCNNISIKIG